MTGCLPGSDDRRRATHLLMSAPSHHSAKPFVSACSLEVSKARNMSCRSPDLRQTKWPMRYWNYASIAPEPMCRLSPSMCTSVAFCLRRSHAVLSISSCLVHRDQIKGPFHLGGMRQYQLARPIPRPSSGEQLIAPAQTRLARVRGKWRATEQEPRLEERRGLKDVNIGRAIEVQGRPHELRTRGGERPDCKRSRERQIRAILCMLDSENEASQGMRIGHASVARYQRAPGDKRGPAHPHPGIPRAVTR